MGINDSDCRVGVIFLFTRRRQSCILLILPLARQLVDLSLRCHHWCKNEWTTKRQVRVDEADSSRSSDSEVVLRLRLPATQDVAVAVLNKPSSLDTAALPRGIHTRFPILPWPWPGALEWRMGLENAVTQLRSNQTLMAGPEAVLELQAERGKSPAKIKELAGDRHTLARSQQETQ